jgi:hypothetical protein
MKIRRLCIGALVAALGVSGGVLAGERDRARAVPLLPKYVQECASCHMAYPPGFLPPASWRRILENLPRHYGTDASLDAATLKELSGWLVANGGTSKRGREVPPDDRVTRVAWFVRKHDEVPANAWARPAIKSPANCAACHAKAEQGDFNERAIRIPR